MSLLDVGCGPGTITVDLAALVAPGRVDRRRDRRGRAGPARAEADARALTNVDFAVADVHALRLRRRQLRRRPRPPGAAARRPTRSRRCARCAGCAARAAWSPPATATTRRSPGTPRCPELDEWLALYQRRRPRQRRRAGRRPPAAVLGPRRRLHRRDRDREYLVLRRPTQTGPGGAACGPTGSSTRPSPTRPSPPARPRRPTWSGSPPAGGPGPPTPDGWFVILHGEILCRA